MAYKSSLTEPSLAPEELPGYTEWRRKLGTLVEPPCAPPPDHRAGPPLGTNGASFHQRPTLAEPPSAPTEEEGVAWKDRCGQLEKELQEANRKIDELQAALIRLTTNGARAIPGTTQGASSALQMCRPGTRSWRPVVKHAPSCPSRHRQNEGVRGTAEYSNLPPPRGGLAHTRMLIVALDYANSRTVRRLTSSTDGKNMEKLANACGVTDVRAIYNEHATFQNVAKLIMDVGQDCGPNDYFIFYFAGHGASVKDEDGDEADGEDEAFCLVTPQGEVTKSSCMIDDYFADLILRSVPESASVIVLSDCCHSGSIADLSKDAWKKRQAISISGCLDNQESSDMGKGGVFTQSMLLAVDKLAETGNSDYSVGKLFNAILREDNKTFKASQTITIHYSEAVQPSRMAWPLIPIFKYQAPLRKAAREGKLSKLTLSSRGADVDGIPDDLAEWAKSAGIDLNENYDDPELENGWKPYKAKVDKINKAMHFTYP